MKSVSTGLFLCHCLVSTLAAAAQPAAPTIELLLYLADLETDTEGRPVDPLDLPDDPPQTAARQPPADTAPPPSPNPEYPR